MFLAHGSESSVFSVLMLVGGDPVDSGVSSDGLVEWVHKNDFVKLERTVLTDPVRVQHSQVLASSADSVLSKGSVGPAWFQLVDTLVHGLTVNNTLAHWSLSATSSDSDSVDHVALLPSVAQLSGLIGSAGSLSLVDHWQLSVFPGSHTKHESQHIGLLLSPQLLKILVRTHLYSLMII